MRTKSKTMRTKRTVRNRAFCQNGAFSYVVPAPGAASCRRLWLRFCAAAYELDMELLHELNSKYGWIRPIFDGRVAMTAHGGQGGLNESSQTGGTSIY
jgi:hypothetical protein